MTLASTSEIPSIFKDGKPKPAVYKIRNYCYGYYLDFDQLSKEVCCRTSEDLEDGRGLVRLRLRSLWFVSLTTRGKWEIKNFSVGYTVKAVDAGKPDQFCNPTVTLEGASDGSRLFVTDYPVAWRIENVEDERFGGSEHVRFFWGPTNRTWDVLSHQGPNNAKVTFEDCGGREGTLGQTWRLIPVKVEDTSTPSQPLPETIGSDTLPSYDGGKTTQSSAQAQHVEYERDDFGTVVTEVTTKTTTTTTTTTTKTAITTRKKYRAEDA